MNIPNRLTILRTILIPVFVVIYFCDSIPYNGIIALSIYIVACITDFLDGAIARRNNLITNFGKFLDPLADKLLVNTALICFVATPDNPIPLWVVLVIIARDFIINGVRLVASDNGVVIAADYWGKVKTTFQMIMVSFLIINIDNPVINVIEYILIYSSAALTLISLFDCIIKNIGVLKSVPDNSAENKAGKIVNVLTGMNKTITFAESCTGGLLCAAMIDIPGSSAVIKESIITYCDEAKNRRLGVSNDILEQYTAVSEQAAAGMAEGARYKTGADIAISVTGIAGPDSGYNGSIPAGTVYIGISNESFATAYEYHFSGDRNSVRTQAVDAAMDIILKNIGE